jgi:hypothetical protein
LPRPAAAAVFSTSFSFPFISAPESDYFSSDCMDSSIPAEDIQLQLQNLSTEFEALHGRSPCRSDIAAEPSWSRLFHSLKAAERLAAEGANAADGGPRAGGCEVYIPRRRRFCSHAAAGGSTRCSKHLQLLLSQDLLQAAVSPPPTMQVLESSMAGRALEEGVSSERRFQGETAEACSVSTPVTTAAYQRLGCNASNGHGQSYGLQPSNLIDIKGKHEAV